MKLSRIGLLGFICVALTAWVVWGAPRSTQSEVRVVVSGATNRVIIYPGPTDTLAKVAGLGVTNLVAYGSYWLAEATDAQLVTLRRALSGRVEEVNYFNQIELGGSSFNVKQGVAVPARLQEANGEARRLRLVQFKGPVLPEWLKQLRSIPSVRIINYVPNNAYLISVLGTAESKLQTLTSSNGPVQWIGVYQPAFKVPQSLQHAVGVVGVKIAVLNDEGAGPTLQTIRRYALGTVEEHVNALGQWLVTLQLNANELPTLAQLPGVLWMQPVYTAQTHDEVQALVLAGFTNNAGGPQSGSDSYVSFLSGLGFSTDSTTYPVLDICDTGVDKQWNTPPSTEIGSCQVSSPFLRWHPSFYYPSPTVSPDLSCCAPNGYSTRFWYNSSSATTDVDGHGTRVASIAVGFDTDPDETINCINQSFSTNVVTNVTFVVNGCTNTTCYIDPIGGTNRCDTTIYNCNLTNVATHIFCSTNNPLTAVGNIPPPPYYLSRVDANGFQLGLGISPYGRFGASDYLKAKDNPVPLVAGIYLTQARISNNSWTFSLSIGGNDGVYDSYSQDYDTLTRDALSTGVTNSPGQQPKNQEMLFIFAAGNDNGVDGVGGYGDVLTTPPATAKNVITVGAARLDHNVFQENSDTFSLSPTTSFGPTRDGRFKPDVVAPGQGVTAAFSQGAYVQPTCGGCDPNNPNPYACAASFSTIPIISQLYNDRPVAGFYFASYPAQETTGTFGGSRDTTSYAAAAVSGGAQLLWWWFQNQLSNSGQYVNTLLPYLLQPSPAMTKAYIINSARYLPITNPLIGSQDKLPSICQGMGMMDLARMFDSTPRVIRDESTPRAIDCTLCQTNPVIQQTYFSQSGQSYELSGTVVDSTQPFRVTLAWTDAPGNPANLKQLVNDLDLQVTVNGQAYAGNDFDTQYSAARATPVYDHLNNVESVFLPPNSLTNGSPWSVVVRATALAGDAVPKVGNNIDQDFALVVYNGTSVTDILPVVGTNNSCQTAVTLSTFPYSWSNTLSSATYAKVHPSPVAGRGGVGEFFKIAQPSPGTTFSVNTYGSGFDTVLSVWYGQCGALVEEVSNNDSSNTTQSAVVFTADGTNDYYIIAEPHNNGAGGLLKLNVQASSSLVTFSPSSLLFAQQISGTTSLWQTVTLQNGLTVPLEVESVSLVGSNAGEFVILSDNCTGAQIQPTNGACAINIAFAPTNASPKTAQLMVIDNATGSPRYVPLFGTGLAAAPVVCLSANRLTYNNTFVGNTDAVQTVTVRNCGTDVLTLTNAVITGPASSDYFPSVPFASTNLDPGASWSFDVNFAPTTNGNRNAVLTFFDNASDNPQQVLLAGKGCTTISMTPTNLPNPTAGVAYSQAISATGGGAPYTYALSLGSLPGGLTFGASGTISGTATNVGTFTFQITATDAFGCSSSPQQYTVTVGCPPLTVTPISLPAGLQWTQYINNFGVLGGNPPYTYSVIAGAIPSGLTINPTNGVFSGTATAAGTNNFTVLATDSAGCTGTNSYTVIINPTTPLLSFTPTLLPTFGNIVLGTTSSVQVVTVSNPGTAPLVITNVTLAGPNPGEFILEPLASCIGTQIPAGGTCTINIKFTPTTSGNKGASVMVWDNSDGNPHSFTVKGAGIAPLIVTAPTSVNFGTQIVNVDSALQWVEIYNTGDGPLTITDTSVISTNGPDFTVVTNRCLGSPIQPGSSCSIGIKFTPGATLPRTGTLVITGTATNSPLRIPLQGVGTNTAPSIAFVPSELTFTETVTGTTGAVQTITVTNAGTASLVISGLGFNTGDTGDFLIVNTGCLGASIPAGGLCAIQVAFAPTAGGVRSTNLRILSNSGNGTNTIPVSGSGVGPIISVSTKSIDFGTNLVGVTSAPRSVTVTNNGNAALVINSVTIGGVNPGDFNIVSDTCVGSPILPGGTCRIQLTFKTTASLQRGGILTIAGVATNAIQTVALSGVGTNVSCPAIGINTSLPAASASVFYSQSLLATGGVAPYVFAVTDGVLPAGLSLSLDGQLTGIPTQLGTNTFTIGVNDSFGCPGTRTYAFSVGCPTWSLTPTTLPTATNGVGYSQTLLVDTNNQLVGGAAKFDNNRPLAFSGTAASGLVVTNIGNSISNVTVSLNLEYFLINAPYGNYDLPNLTLIGPDGTTVSLLSARSVSLQSQQSTDAVYGNSCDSGSRLTFNDSALSGVSKSSFSEPGLSNGLTSVTTLPVVGLYQPDHPLAAFSGKNGSAVNGTWQLVIQAGGTVVSDRLNCWSLSFQTPVNFTFAVQDPGNFPPGVSLSSDGVFSGTPTASGTYTFHVLISDPAGCQNVQTYTLNVANGAPTIGYSPQLLPTFGDVSVGKTGTVQTITLSSLGNVNLMITNIAIVGANPSDFTVDTSVCLGVPLPPNSTCPLKVNFTPTTSGNRSALVAVYSTDPVNNPIYLQLKGAGITPSISALPSSVNFGTQTVNVVSAPQWVQVYNTGNGPLTITGLALISTNAPDFAISDNTCLGSPIQPGDSCSIGLTFKPGAALARTATLVINSDGTNGQQRVRLSGFGANTGAALGLHPTSLIFGDTTLNTTSAVQSVTVTNGGTAALVISSVGFTGGNAGEFVVLNSTCVGAGILPGNSCTIQVGFAPTGSAARVSNLQLLSNSGNGTNLVPVSGSGVGPFISLSANALDFGSNIVGVVSPVESVIVSNSGNGLLVINSLVLGGLNPGDFSITSSNCVGSGILPGKTCVINLTFQTQAALPRSATLSIVGNEMNLGAPVTIALTGVGKQFVCPTITVGPATLPNAFSKVKYNQNLTGSGSGGLYTYTLSRGQLPDGITLTAGGVLSGLPRTIGTNTFTITATDANGCSGSRDYSLSVSCPTLTILPSSVAQATMGSAYNQPLSVRLPDGTAVSSTLRFDNLTSFAISDAVTQNIGGVIYYFYGVGSQLTFTSTVTVAGVDAAITNLTASMYLNYHDDSQSPLALRTGLGQLTVKLIGPDNTTVTLTGGNGGPGNNFGVACAPDSSHTVFSDSALTAIADPVNTSPYTGTFRPDVPLSAFVGKSGTGVNGVWTLEVDVAPSFMRADSGTVFCWGLSIASPQITFAVTSGSLPPGITLTVGGLLSGTPTASGSYTSTVTVTDASGCTGSQPLVFDVAPTAPIISFVPNPLPTFGDVVVGTTSAVQSVTVTNLGNGPLVITNVTLTGANAGDFKLNPVSSCLSELLLPGDSCQINVTFNPTAAGNRAATVLVFDNATNSPHSFQVTGAGITPAILTVPSSLNFGTQTVAMASAPQWVDVFNTGNGPLTITGLSVVGTNAPDFVIYSSDCLFSTIQPGESCSIGVGFTPAASFARSGTLVIDSDATNGQQRVALRGAGIVPAGAGIIVVSPPALNFGTQLIDTTSAAQPVYVSNVGNTILNVTDVQIGGLNPTDYYIVGDFCQQLLPGQICQINVVFFPQVAVTRTGILYINSTATNGQQQVALSGTGSTAVGVLSLSTTNLDFGIQTNSVTAVHRTVLVSDIGSAALLITNISITGSGASAFTVGASTCSNAILNPADVCQINVIYTPTVDGIKTATLQVSRVPGGTTNISLFAGRFFDSSGITNCPGVAITLAPTAFGIFRTGVAVNQQITAAGGNAPYHFSVASGTLPPGLTLGSDGSLTGAIITAGNYSFTVRAVDQFGCSGTQNYTINALCPLLDVIPQILTNSFVGSAYSQPIALSSGPGPFIYSVVAGSLPPGLAFTTNGYLAGTPTAGGIYTFTLRISNALGCYGERVYTVTIGCSAITMTTGLLSNAQVGVAYSAQFTAANGTLPLVFSQSGGALPQGLTLTDSGLLSGIPTGGSGSFTITVTDSHGCVASQDYDLTVSIGPPVFVLTAPSVQSVNVNEPVLQQLTVSGGTGPVTFTIVDGVLPSGLTLSLDGNLTGTATNLGTVAVTIQAQDSAGHTARQSLTLNVVTTPCALILTPANLRNGAVNQAYSTQLSATGGSSAETTYAVVSNTLPTGLTLSNAGLLAGTPTTEGAADFWIRAQNGSCSVTNHYAITINANGQGNPSVVNKVLITNTAGIVTIKVSGTAGLAVSQADANTNRIGQVTVTGTDAHTILTITVKKANRSSDGLVEIGTITTDSDLASLAGASVNIVNGGVTIAGKLGIVTLNALRQATLSAGGAIGLAAIKNFANSHVTAPQLGKVNLTAVTTNNGGSAFGIQAPAITSVTVKSPKGFKWKKTGPVDQALGDFHVVKQ